MIWVGAAAGPAHASGYGPPQTFATGFDEPTLLASDGTHLFVDNYEEGQIVEVAPEGTQSIAASGYVSPYGFGVDPADE